MTINLNTGGALIPGVPIDDETKGLITQLEGSESQTVTDIGKLADSLSGSGSLTEGQKALLAATAKLAINDPSISAADKLLLNSFIDKLASMPYTPGGEPSVPVGNAWLNVTAFVTVCMMIFEITSELSAIKLSEAQLQILMTKVNAQMAAFIAQVIVASGQLESEMHTNEAYKAAMQAGMCMSSMALTGLTTVVRQMKIANATEAYKQTHHGLPPDGAALEQIERNVDAEMALVKQLAQSLPEMINALTSASVESQNAVLTLLKAQSDATSAQLQKLAELLKGTIDTLRGDQSEQSQTIAKLLDNFLSAFSRGRLNQGN